MMRPPERTFLQIRAAKRLRLEALAELAKVNTEDIYYLEAGVSYPRAFIDTVLEALSLLSGETCTYENVGGIYACEEGQHESTS